jgi:hypothetical protein
LVVENKADLEKERQVGGELTNDFAEWHYLESIETSALSGKNIKEAFARMMFAVSTRVRNGSIAVSRPPNRPVQLIPFAYEQQKKRGMVAVADVGRRSH